MFHQVRGELGRHVQAKEPRVAVRHKTAESVETPKGYATGYERSTEQDCNASPAHTLYSTLRFPEEQAGSPEKLPSHDSQAKDQDQDNEG